LAGGAGIEVIDGLVIDLSTLYVFYQKETASGAIPSPAVTDMDKKVWLFGVGATYSF
jgi:long-subunit fatty acid transport protein